MLGLVHVGLIIGAGPNVSKKSYKQKIRVRQEVWIGLGLVADVAKLVRS